MSMPGLGFLPDGRVGLEPRSMRFPYIGQRERDVPGQGAHPGRSTRVRAKLSMPEFNARRYNPVIGGFYARLVARGKTFKQAMTACMRKLLVLMNTLVARGQVWSPSYAT